MAELVEGRSCLGRSVRSALRLARGPERKLRTGCAAVQRGNGPHGRPKASLPNQCDGQSGCLRAISGQLDEQTLTVFMPVSASARVL
jgi:hypothetical protein